MNFTNHGNVGRKFRWFATSVWCFPAIVLALLFILTVLQISGTSIGTYHTLLYGKQNDPALLLGVPRPIRSDEWGVVTPMTISQAKEDFRAVNPTIGNGQDMVVTLDVPVKDWSSLFRPQNWSFFALPLSYAFAFKWWLIGALLVLSCYALVLALLPRAYLWASLVSVGLFLSPFVQWWYQPTTLLTIAYGLMLAWLVIYLYREPVSPQRRILAAVATAYVATCLIFIFYIPFIIPVCLVLTAFLAGHVINLYKEQSFHLGQFGRQSVPLLAAGVVALGLGLFFLHSHSATVQTIASTVYPGHRTETSGGMQVTQLFGGYYNFQLQDSSKAAHLDANQSEASSFVLLFPFLIPLLAYILTRRKKLRIAVDWRIVCLLAVALLFFIRFFVPFSEIIFNALQLNRIPHNRMLIGVGLLNLLLVIISIQHVLRAKTLPSRLIQVSTGFTFFGVLVVGLLLKTHLNGYLENPLIILFVSGLVAAIVWTLLQRKITAALVLIAVFSAVSAGFVNPLYRGLDILTSTPISRVITARDDGRSKWVIGDYAASFESFPAANGAKTLSGVYAYPQLGIWQDVAKDKASEDVYNRYAHVFFSVGPLGQPALGHGAYFDPPALDAFRVHADACSAFLKDQQVRYVILTTDTSGACFKKLATVPYPKLTFYIYELVR